MHNRAGQPATPADLIDLEALGAAYFQPVNPADPAQQVVFGTSGHRGSSLHGSFNEAQIAAICAAVAEYRSEQGITGPLFVGADSHPLSEPAAETAYRVLVASGVRVLRSKNDEYVPTPAVSHAIIKHNARGAELADGLIITPSHNPPADGGIKYNQPHGGPADTAATGWIAARANELLGASGGSAATLISQLAAQDGGELGEHDFLSEYVADLAEVVDIAAIKRAGIGFAAHPLGGAADAYWRAIAERHGLNITVLGPGIDKQWGFMSLDWDGKIRMDPSSCYAMAAVLTHQDRFPLTVANDADADRHGIVTPDGGLLNPNHYLAVVIDYLLTHRPAWSDTAGIGKTIVSSQIIDRVVASHGRALQEVPVGFKWFVPGLSSGELVFGGEESAGASLVTRDGSAWSTDKDGIALSLLAAEILAVTGKSPSQYYAELTAKHGSPAYARIDAPATPEQKAKLLALTVDSVAATEFAGERIREVLTHAPGNNAAIGGLVIRTGNAWCAIRPSGTEAVMKIYAESFHGPEHLAEVQRAATALLTDLLK